MSIEHKDLLVGTVKGIKKSLGFKDGDYVTVIITVLIGKEEEVIEAEATIDFSVDQDDLPCKSAVIKLSDWKGEVEEE